MTPKNCTALIGALAEEHEALTAERNELKVERDALEARAADRDAVTVERNELKVDNDKLKVLVAQYKKLLFGPRSEKLSPRPAQPGLRGYRTKHRRD